MYDYLNTYKALNYHCFWCLFYVICTLFWLELDSNLENTTGFTLSKFKYLIFTKSKLLSLFSHFIAVGYSVCWTSCTALPSHSDIWPCLYLYILCRLPSSDSSFDIHCFSFHTQDTASTGVLYQNIYRFLPISSHLHYPFVAYYALVFVYLSL